MTSQMNIEKNAFSPKIPIKCSENKRQKHNQLGIVCFTFSEKKSFSKIFHSCIKRLSDMSDI